MNYYNYFTEVEEHFVKRRGKSLTVSPLDWSLIAEWKNAGIPLNVALRGIDFAMDSYFSRPRRSTEKLSTLVYCYDAVMQEFERFNEAHVGEDKTAEGATETGSPDRGPDKASLLAFLEQRIAEIKSLPAKHSIAEGIERILDRLVELTGGLTGRSELDYESLERDLGILDQLLISELTKLVPEEQAAEWAHEAKAELKVYRKRLPKETYARILENYLATRTRRLFNVGEMSLLHL